MRQDCGTLGTEVIGVMATLTMQDRSSSGEVKPQDESVQKLLDESNCRSCHAMDHKVVGPSYIDVAKKYGAQPNSPEQLARSIREGGSGKWGNVAMPPHPDLSDAQLTEMVRWILSLNSGASDRPEQAKAKEYTYTVNGKTVTVDFPLFV